MCENTVIEEPFMIKFVPNCYKTQRKCEKSVSGYLPMLKYFPNK